MQLILPITLNGKRLEISGDEEARAEIIACGTWLENHAGATKGEIKRQA